MMTPQETQALREFLAQLTQVQGIAKDAQASSMIAQAFAQQPDAGYLLVQRSMLQDQALATARTQIAQLQAEVQSARDGTRGGSGGGFLDPANAWGNSAGDNARAAGASAGRVVQSPQRFDSQAQPQYANAPGQQYAQQNPQQYAQPARPGLFGGGGGSGFLGSMAATAAGVAGGAFLFQGIESLMGHHGGGNGLMGQNGAAPVENTTINNYYGDETASDDRSTAGADTGADTGTREALFDDGGSNDFAGNDDLGSSDDMSSI